MVGRLTLYSTPWCGHCKRLKTQLQREGIDFVEIDIGEDPDGEHFVLTTTGGSATVPTVAFPDGTALTNPSLADVKRLLSTAG